MTTPEITKSPASETTLPVFDDIFQTYREPIHRYLLGMTQNPTEAEDLAQETFIRVYNNLPGFRGDASLSTWLYRIARNAFIDHTRRSSTKQSGATLPLEKANLVSASAPTPEEMTSRSEMSNCVRNVIRRLPENYRTALILHDLRNLKNREIAEILDCSLDTVKVRLHRARRKLQAALDYSCDMSYTDYGVLGCDLKEGISMDICGENKD